MSFIVHHRFSFTSERKRMSVLVTDPRDGLIKLYTKGADSEILKRLKEGSLDEETKKKCDEFLTRCSKKGYRTLLMAMKVVD